MKKRWKIAVGILAAVLVLAVVGVGVVAADDPDETQPVAGPLQPQRNPAAGVGIHRAALAGLRRRFGDQLRNDHHALLICSVRGIPVGAGNQGEEGTNSGLDH